MENYGDEILWDAGPTPSRLSQRGKNETLWFPFFSTIISATFSSPVPPHRRPLRRRKLFRVPGGAGIVLSWNLRAPLWHYLKLSFFFPFSAVSSSSFPQVFHAMLKHEASSSLESHEGWYGRDKLCFSSFAQSSRAPLSDVDIWSKATSVIISRA